MRTSCFLQYAILSVLLVSCGTETNFVSNINPLKIKGNISSLDINERFSQQVAESLYTEQTVQRAGKTWPYSKSPEAESFSLEEAPDGFVEEFGTFTYGGEARGYLNLGETPEEMAESRIISLFEAVSKWKNILNPDGVPYFKETYATTESFRRINDQVDGEAPLFGENLYGTLISDVGPIDLRFDSRVSIANRFGKVYISYMNQKKVSAPFVGTLIKARNLQFGLEFYPWRNGFLVYGWAKVTLDRMQERFPKDQTTSMVTSIFNWVNENVVLPIDD